MAEDINFTTGRYGRRNFSPEEREFMLELVSEYSHIIDNKATTAVSNQAKLRAWMEISERFNSSNHGFNRMPKQLWDCYKNFKKKSSQEKNFDSIIKGISVPEEGDVFMLEQEDQNTCSNEEMVLGIEMSPWPPENHYEECQETDVKPSLITIEPSQPDSEPSNPEVITPSDSHYSNQIIPDASFQEGPTILPPYSPQQHVTPPETILNLTGARQRGNNRLHHHVFQKRRRRANQALHSGTNTCVNSIVGVKRKVIEEQHMAHMAEHKLRVDIYKAQLDMYKNISHILSTDPSSLNIHISGPSFGLPK